MSLTIDIKELKERWMKWYLNMMILQSNNPDLQKVLDQIKGKLAEFNELVMEFYDIFE